MYNILLVADANSIFMLNYVKAIKRICDIKVTVYSPFLDRHIQDIYPYDNVCFDDYNNSFLGKLPFWGTRLQPYFQRYKFEKFLKSQTENFDIIHFHWLLPAWTLFPHRYRKYSSIIGGTMWGGELEQLKLLQSKNIYRYKLKKLLSLFSFYVGVADDRSFLEKCTFFRGDFFYGMYGSSIIEEMSHLNVTKKDAKHILKIAPDKITVMLGYSGKIIHRHKRILNKILADKRFEMYREHLHFVASMTRGATNAYKYEIEEVFKKTGCSYTMIKSGYQTDKDVAILRYATDVAFQLSDFDGLSNSIKEILSAGAILICGDWYPTYHTLQEDGFTFIEVSSFEEGVEKFYDVLFSYSNYVDEAQTNIAIGRERYLWSTCIKPWACAYEKLLFKE